VEEIITLLANAGIKIALEHQDKIISFFKKPRTIDEIQKEILPIVKFTNSEIDSDGLWNIITDGGIEIKNSKVTMRGTTNMISTKDPVTLKITNTEKPQSGKVIGSISFTNKGVVIDSTDNQD
jgi:hypothetical protein